MLIELHLSTELPDIAHHCGDLSPEVSPGPARGFHMVQPPAAPSCRFADRRGEDMSLQDQVSEASQGVPRSWTIPKPHGETGETCHFGLKHPKNIQYEIYKLTKLWK